MNRDAGRRNAQIIRQWRILQALNDCKWWSINEIMDAAKIHNRHRRTVMRDMDALIAVFGVERRETAVGDAGKLTGVTTHYEYRLRRPIFQRGKLWERER